MKLAASNKSSAVSQTNKSRALLLSLCVFHHCVIGKNTFLLFYYRTETPKTFKKCSRSCLEFPSRVSQASLSTSGSQIEHLAHKYGVMIVTDVVVPKSYPTRRVSTSTGELLEHVGSNVFHSVLIKTANLTRKKKNTPPKLTSQLF